MPRPGIDLARVDFGREGGTSAIALCHRIQRGLGAQVVCFALDMMTFKAILMGKSKQDDSDKLSFISSIELLKPLPDVSSFLRGSRSRLAGVSVASIVPTAECVEKSGLTCDASRHGRAGSMASSA